MCKVHCSEISSSNCSAGYYTTIVLCKSCFVQSKAKERTMNNAVTTDGGRYDVGSMMCVVVGFVHGFCAVRRSASESVTRFLQNSKPGD
jgi:hypothetical protein